VKALAAMVAALLVFALTPAPANATTANPSFGSTGSLTAARSNAAAVALGDGRVLVAGGCHYSAPQQHMGCTVPTAELYDPETETFGATGPMAYGRVYAAAAPLPGGKALIAGGANTEGVTPALTTAEVYDPEAETFSLTTSAPLTARWGAAAAALPDGRVLVAGGVGGFTGSNLSSAEIFDPETGTFSSTGSMSTSRRMALAAPLPDGRVLVAGGFGSGGSAEIFDPVSETFSSTGSMAGEASLIVAGAALADGSVLAFGDAGYTGFEAPRVRELQQYDPATGTFSLLSLASPPRSGMAVAPLPGGRLLVAGGAGDEPKAWLGHEIVPTAEIFVSAPSPQSDGLDFGAVPVSETTGPEAMTITNLGAQGLEVEAASLTGAAAADFEIVEDDCTDETLAFEESCELLISVTPSSAEPLTAAVQLTDNAPSSPQSFPLSANGEELPAPEAAPPVSQPVEDTGDDPESSPGQDPESSPASAPAASAPVPPSSADSPAAAAASGAAVAAPTQQVRRPCRRATKRPAARCSRPPAKRHRTRARHGS
jgi:hypothetical protein